MHQVIRGFKTASKLQNKVAIQFFTKQDCGLCNNAKDVLDYVIETGKLKRPIDVEIVDINKPENKNWWELYVSTDGCKFFYVLTISTMIFLFCMSTREIRTVSNSCIDLIAKN